MCTSNYIRKHYILLTQTTLATTRNPGLLLLWARNRRRPRVGGESWHGILWARDTRYWIVFDHRTAKLTPSSEKVASLRHKCKFESKDVLLLTKRLDFRKKEKNATKHAAQKVTSSGKVKSICLNNWRRIGVMGSFCLCAAPNTLCAKSPERGWHDLLLDALYEQHLCIA